MSKGKRKINYDNIGSNPLAESLHITGHKKIKDVINKFGNADKLETKLDGDKCVKIYEVSGYKAKMMKLNIRSKEMLLYIYHIVKYKQDYILLDREDYMKAHEITSINTFKKAIVSLCNEKYIYPHHLPEFKDVYWINPAYFFKGSRLAKYPHKVNYTDKEVEDEESID